jgi:hypothetical protein
MWKNPQMMKGVEAMGCCDVVTIHTLDGPRGDYWVEDHNMPRNVRIFKDSWD